MKGKKLKEYWGVMASKKKEKDRNKLRSYSGKEKAKDWRWVQIIWEEYSKKMSRKTREREKCIESCKEDKEKGKPEKEKSWEIDRKEEREMDIIEKGKKN